MRRIALATLLVIAFAPRAESAACDPARALPPGFVDEVLHTFAMPVTTIRPLSDGRIIVGLGDGKAYLMSETGELAAAPFADFAIVPYVGTNGSEVVVEAEGGVIGAAESPSFATDRHIYLSHTTLVTAPGGRKLEITRYTLEPSGLAAVAGSETTIYSLTDANQATDYHSGGGISFGADGKLYWGIGDDANPVAPQQLTSLRGKILRMNPDGTAPSDNPFYIEGDPGVRNYIFATGQRNPYRNFWDAGRGHLVATDTGQGRWEEMNTIEAGKNYGWALIEGPAASNPGVTPPAEYADPLWAYRHGLRTFEGIAIVGAARYDGAMFPPEYAGDYFATEWGIFGYATKIFRLRIDDDGSLIEPQLFHSYRANFGFSDIAIDRNGAMWYTLANMAVRPPYGEIRRITYAPPDAAPTASIGASATSGNAPLAVNFTSTVSDDSGTPTICWNFGDGGSTSSAANPSRTFQNPGIYTVTLTAEDSFFSRTVDTETISVTKVTKIDIDGTLFDATGTVPAPMAGTFTIRQSDGALVASQPIAESGAFDFVLDPFVATDKYIVVEFASPGFATKSTTIALAAQGFLSSADAYLAQTAITGRVLLEEGTSAQGVDVFLQREEAATLLPYAIPGGIDLAPPLTPTGVLHGVRTGLDGRFYMPIRTGDTADDFLATANLQPTLSAYRAQGAEVIPDAMSEPLELTLPRIVTANECESVAPTGPIDASFARVQGIFSDHCIGCHGTVAPNAGLTLADGFAYSMLVDQPSTEHPTRKLIDTTSPGDAVVNSFLVEKIRCARPAYGSIMPPTVALTIPDIEAIGTWARNRAPHGSVRTAIHASRETALSPALISFIGGHEGPGAPFTFEWDFGDGATGAGAHPDHTYVVVGEERQFDVVMTAKNLNGAVVGTQSVTITVSAAPTWGELMSVQ